MHRAFRDHLAAHGPDACRPGGANLVPPNHKSSRAGMPRAIIPYFAAASMKGVLRYDCDRLDLHARAERQRGDRDRRCRCAAQRCPAEALAVDRVDGREVGSMSVEERSSSSTMFCEPAARVRPLRARRRGLSRTRRVCAATSPSSSFPVAGSIAICPLQKSIAPDRTA